MLAAIAAGNFGLAADELGDSRWARQVQHSRSTRLIEQLRSGTISGSTEEAEVSGYWYPAQSVTLAGSVKVTVDFSDAAKALLSGLSDGIKQTIVQEIQAMSGTLEQQVQQIAASISSSASTLSSDMDTIKNAIDQLQQAAQPGNSLTQADVDALNAAAAAVSSAQATADQISGSVSNLNPTPTPTPPGP
jgi:methyl-accepting chemotaxis protein